MDESVVMATRDAEANGLHRFVRRLATKRPVIWVFSRVLHHLDKLVFRLTNGRQTAASIFTGLPVIHLTTIGAKSGQPRTVPLIGSPDGDKIVIIASNWGQKQYPAWYYNVRANGAVVVEQNGRSANYTAQEVAGPEREKYWQLAHQYYLGFATYAQRASNRHLPVIILKPK